MRCCSPIKDPKVSVIIAAYNEATRIRACIVSLQGQDIRGIEVIVADDGSIDGTPELAASMGAKVLRNSHAGPGAARNLGVRAASGDIVVIVDADMTFAPDYVTKLIRPIEEGRAIASTHWNERVANWENPWARCETWFQGLPDGRRQPLIMPERHYVYRAVRRDFFLESGGYAENEGRGDDSSIARRTGVFASPVPEAVCFHLNADNPREVFFDARWRGRNIAAVREGRWQKVASAFLGSHNPLLSLLRGVKLSCLKGEPRLLPYSAVFSAGFLCGAAGGLLTGRYQK